jgi:hypothetical protein
MLVIFNYRGQKVYQRRGLFVGKFEVMHAGTRAVTGDY